MLPQGFQQGQQGFGAIKLFSFILTQRNQCVCGGKPKVARVLFWLPTYAGAGVEGAGYLHCGEGEPESGFQKDGLFRFQWQWDLGVEKVMKRGGSASTVGCLDSGSGRGGIH
jgi:hypothetical protein